MLLVCWRSLRKIDRCHLSHVWLCWWPQGEPYLQRSMQWDYRSHWGHSSLLRPKHHFFPAASEDLLHSPWSYDFKSVRQWQGLPLQICHLLPRRRAEEGRWEADGGRLDELHVSYRHRHWAPYNLLWSRGEPLESLRHRSQLRLYVNEGGEGPEENLKLQRVWRQLRA